jgi:polyisoprenoid-binding protein YceI
MTPPAAALAAALLLGAADAAPTETARYEIDGAQSTLAWELPATLHTVHGRVPELSGFVEIETASSGERWVRGRVVVRAAAMTTGNDSRDRKMREETLETSKFPDIVFELRKVAVDWAAIQPGRSTQASAAGELSIRGQALAIEVAMRVEASERDVVLSGGFDLPWKAFHLKDPSFGFVTVREPLKVSFRLRAVRSEGGGGVKPSV